MLFGKQNEVNLCNTKQYFNCDQKFFIKQLNTSTIAYLVLLVDIL